jgi:hypothetical protein
MYISRNNVHITQQCTYHATWYLILEVLATFILSLKLAATCDRIAADAVSKTHVATSSARQGVCQYLAVKMTANIEAVSTLRPAPGTKMNASPALHLLSHSDNHAVKL